MFKFKRAFEQKNRCDVRFEQAYRHVRQFVSKSGLHKFAFSPLSRSLCSFFPLARSMYVLCAPLSHSHLVVVLKMLTNAIIK